MKKHNRKAAIELSANFIVVMIISIVILVGGLSVFYKLIDGAQKTVKKYDIQTETMIKEMMTAEARTAVWPGNTKIDNGDGAWIGVGVHNVYDDTTVFTVKLIKVIYHVDSSDDGTNAPGALQDYYDTSSEDITILPQEKVVKGVLIKMPKTATEGQYVYTISITHGIDSYGIVQVTASNN